jgi:hypothetical protein
MFPQYRPGRARSAKAEENISQYRIVKPGSADGTAVAATAATDNLIGVVLEENGNDPSDTVLDGEMFDYAVEGDIPVEYGDTVTKGDWLTSDGQGRAVPCDSDGQETIGKALVGGILGDIGVVEIAKGTYQS